jgi:hypothetical protein
MDKLDTDTFQYIIASVKDKDLETLKVITTLSDLIDQVKTKNIYWYKKAEFLLNTKLSYRENFDWRNIYNNIEKAKNKYENINADKNKVRKPKKNLFLWYEPEKNHFLWYVIKENNPDAVSVMYESGQKSISGKDTNVLIDKIKYMRGYVGWLKDGSRYIDEHANEFKMIKVLVEEGGIDPSAFDNRAIIEAANKNYPDVVEYLLQYPNVDPSAQNNDAI